MKKFLLLVLVLLVPVAVSAQSKSKFIKHRIESGFAVSASKKFSVEMVVEGEKLQVGVNKAEIYVHDDVSTDIKGVRLKLEPWMPSMGHGVSEKAVITEKEGFFGSRYLVDNLMINMAGDWEIRVDIEKDGFRDKAVLTFAGVGGKGGMKMSDDAMKVPADLDLARTLPSEKKLFTATWGSSSSPPPLNSIHSWTLTIKDQGGRPVTDADIEIGGDMPQHGHGLPTEPELADETAPGVYLIEGMKFSMKGWWTVSFDIEAGGKKDRVTFNLMLK